MTRRRVLTIAVVAGLLTSCTASSSAPFSSTPSVEVPEPVGARLVTSASASAEEDCDPTRSFRPPPVLPEPGQMPVGSTMERIVEDGFLRAGVDQTTNLMGYRDPATNRIDGFDIEMVREVARALFGTEDVDNHIKWVAITSGQRTDVLGNPEEGTEEAKQPQQPQVDIVVRTMTATCERWETVLFSTTYLEARQRILVPQDNEDITGKDDLAGRRVCSATASTSLSRLVELENGPRVTAVPHWSDCLVMLQQQQVDAVSTDDTILAGMVAQDPNLKVVGEPFSSERYAMAFRQEEEDFVRFANGVLERMRADGTWQRLYDAWLAGPLGRASPPPEPRYQD
ncbi:glutamate ABC transporter substrate-binding protein [Actinoalloteichus spitiensis]|uniref:glutamate ABC transporter substrate-binding protein n=1 Tax=Actinoalloteichus spitiensis TaxID=252394 RepID=UPI0002D78928|nr:glutamate ABC transporter substrate-binding protein [Actinoalloteichus spitiensis]